MHKTEKRLVAIFSGAIILAAAFVIYKFQLSVADTLITITIAGVLWFGCLRWLSEDNNFPWWAILAVIFLYGFAVDTHELDDLRGCVVLHTPAERCHTIMRDWHEDARPDQYAP